MGVLNIFFNIVSRKWGRDVDYFHNLSIKGYKSAEFMQYISIGWKMSHNPSESSNEKYSTLFTEN